MGERFVQQEVKKILVHVFDVNYTQSAELTKYKQEHPLAGDPLLMKIHHSLEEMPECPEVFLDDSTCLFNDFMERNLTVADVLHAITLLHIPAQTGFHVQVFTGRVTFRVEEVLRSHKIPYRFANIPINAGGQRFERVYVDGRVEVVYTPR